MMKIKVSSRLEDKRKVRNVEKLLNWYLKTPEGRRLYKEMMNEMTEEYLQKVLGILQKGG